MPKRLDDLSGEERERHIADSTVTETYGSIRAERDRYRAALERIANPAHRPRTEEAALVLIEVEQIAREALDA